MPKKKTPPKSSSTGLLAHFPHPPPASPKGAVALPKRGEPGSWEDEFDRLPDGPEAAPIVGTHWQNARKEFWRFEPDGKLSEGLSGGIFSMSWKEKASWLFLVNASGTEFLARVEGDAIAGYRRTRFNMLIIEYHRADAALIDGYIQSKQEYHAWLIGPRDRPAPPEPLWPPRSSRPAVAARPLRFANHSAARSLATVSGVEQTHLAAHAVTIAAQAEFGGVEAIDLLDGTKLAYRLYWWPFTDGILVDAVTGAVAADLGRRIARHSGRNVARANRCGISHSP